ncbi:hypothetical protein [Pseudanabaena sp. ABRG5-3]|uniref:NACHT C-terminal alpha/beta 1 domain-containing protein n=1 Tax=Pseudanabaena sp. ABRG5-3 TaxID=685565 RepID=UPI000DC6FF0B|nr:hypothetical protein [Pseudanabaena sp. ABRG5-3]BBC26957.1 hypothetical protein ABRG53_c118 [Pseudanabaena sp. ABRG5-3]
MIDKVAKLLTNIDSEEIIIDICDFLLHINTEDACTISFKYLLKLAIKSPFNQNIVMPLQLINICGNIFTKDSDLIKLFTEFIFKLDLDSRYSVFGNIEDPILSKLIYSSNCNKSIYLLENLFIKNPDKLIITLESFKWMNFYFSRYISSFKSNISLSNSIKSKTSKNLKIELEHSKILEEFNPELCLESDTKEIEIKLIYKPREQIISHVANLPIYVKNHDGSKNYSHSDSFNTILQILKKDKIVDIDPTTSIEIDYEDTTHEELFEIALKSLNSTIEYENQEFDYSYCYLLLCNCAKNLSYERFYQVWHSSNDVIYNLETQFVSCEDIQKELDRNTEHPEIRCLVVDIRHLEQESDLNIIAEEIAIKIFDSLGRKIPEINRVSNLKRELINLKRILEVKKLAIALYGKSANEAINQLCQNLTDSIHICPFTGEKSTQQLTKEVKDWLRRIDLEYN